MNKSLCGIVIVSLVFFSVEEVRPISNRGVLLSSLGGAVAGGCVGLSVTRHHQNARDDISSRALWVVGSMAVGGLVGYIISSGYTPKAKIKRARSYVEGMLKNNLIAYSEPSDGNWREYFKLLHPYSDTELVECATEIEFLLGLTESVLLLVDSACQEDFSLSQSAFSIREQNDRVRDRLVRMHDYIFSPQLREIYNLQQKLIEERKRREREQALLAAQQAAQMAAQAVQQSAQHSTTHVYVHTSGSPLPPATGATSYTSGTNANDLPTYAQATGGGALSSTAITVYYNDPCAICLSSYSRSDRIAALNCGHTFHDDCIRQWLNTSKTCPYCRQEKVYVAKIYNGCANVPGYVVPLSTPESQVIPSSSSQPIFAHLVKPVQPSAPPLIKPTASTVSASTQAMVVYHSAECAICLDDYQSSSRVALLSCGHTFHPACINDWLSRSKECPKCRATNVTIVKICENSSQL